MGNHDGVKAKFHGLIRQVRANRIRQFKTPPPEQKAEPKKDDEGAADLPALEAMLKES